MEFPVVEIDINAEQQERLRVEALRLAQQLSLGGSETAQQTVERAEVYYQFLLGRLRLGSE